MNYSFPEFKAATILHKSSSFVHQKINRKESANPKVKKTRFKRDERVLTILSSVSLWFLQISSSIWNPNCNLTGTKEYHTTSKATVERWRWIAKISPGIVIPVCVCNTELLQTFQSATLSSWHLFCHKF